MEVASVTYHYLYQYCNSPATALSPLHRDRDSVKVAKLGLNTLLPPKVGYSLGTETECRHATHSCFQFSSQSSLQFRL